MSASKHTEAEETVVEGVFIPVAWDPSGQVTDLRLMTYDEGEYRIDGHRAGDLVLGSYLRKRVRVVGVVRSDRCISIKHVEVLGRPDQGAAPGVDSKKPVVD